MSRSVATVAMVLILCGAPGHASDFYEWTDNSGVKHFATTLGEVPEPYRSQCTSPKPDPRPKPGAASRPVSAAVPASSDPSAPLRKFEVPYQASEGSAKRVIIPVTFNDAVTAPMALDTGSPGMVISFELATRLGLFSRDNGTLFVGAAGIGGLTPAILTIVDAVSVEGARTAFVPTTVTDALSPAFSGLIGMDFMSTYTVSIDSQKHVVVFQENPAGPNMRGGHDEQWWRSTFEGFRSARDRWEAFAATAQHSFGAKAKSFAEFQTRESERLLRRLDLYASDNAVPRHWR